MFKHLLSICFLSSIVLASCTGSVDPDNGSAISGTYRMTTYNTETSATSNPAPGNNLIVTKVDKNTVKVVIDYADPAAPSVVLDKMKITKNGSVYNLAQSFSNASSSGNVNGSKLTLDIDYTNNDFVHIVSVK